MKRIKPEELPQVKRVEVDVKTKCNRPGRFKRR